MSARISLSRESAQTAYGELSVAIHTAKQGLAAVTDPQDKAVYESLLPSLIAARDELGQQMWPASFDKRAAA
jgi:hypothetical protein